jgi:hypothetical protein
MSERQAKRLRRAQRAYIQKHTTSLENGPRASVTAAKLGDMLRDVWPHLVSHRARGRVSAAMLVDLKAAVRLCVG